MKEKMTRKQGIPNTQLLFRSRLKEATTTSRTPTKTKQQTTAQATAATTTTTTAKARLGTRTRRITGTVIRRT